MPKLKRLSGRDAINFFERSGFRVISYAGSHVKLRRLSSDGVKETLVVPNHNELDTGTCRAIYRQAMRFISPEKLRSFFYSE